MSTGPPAVVPASPAPDPGGEPHDDDPPPPTYLGVDVGADWFADGGHEPMTDDEPDSGPDEASVFALGTVVVSNPHCVLDPWI